MEIQTEEMWQVEAGGEIFDTNFPEMAKWIEEGSLLRIDRVRRGNLRWIEAGKVPLLVAVFNAKESGEPVPPPVVTLTKLGPTSIPGRSEPPALAGGLDVGTNATFGPPAKAGGSDRNLATIAVCSVHPNVIAAFSCGTCLSQFCRACPNSYGGSVKICPMCGAMCDAIAKAETAKPVYAFNSKARGKFGFADFGKALAYPFKFKTSLILGSIMFMLFSVGQGSTSFGGVFMMWGSLACGLLGNTLTFGVLANTVEKFSQGKIGENFMPSFEDFSIWDDVIHPFFLSIGVYLASFGPLIAVVAVAFLMVAGGKQTNGLESDAADSISPGLSYSAGAAQQGNNLKELVAKQNALQKQRLEMMSEPPASAGGSQVESGTDASKTSAPLSPADAGGSDDPDDAKFEKLNNFIQQQRKAQLESVVGKAPETKAAERAALVKQVLGYGSVLLLLGGITLLWGLFYFPAACAVAGYTRSFAATLNPSVVLDTIRRLGVDYVKILAMFFVIVVAAGAISAVLTSAFSAFDMPGVGNMPAKALGSIFTFYLSVIFSCVLGFALFKAADRLQLPS